MRKKLMYFILLALFITSNTSGVFAQAPIVKYQNNFESPNGIVFGPSYIDLSQQNLNTLYGPEIQMRNTVETIGINGPKNLYSDPSGIGGNYAISMLESVQNDLAALSFNVEGLSFVNMNVHVAGIGIKGINGPFVNDNPIFRLTLLDTPGSNFSMSMVNSYTKLDSVTVSGVVSPISIFTFEWTKNSVSLETSGASDGNVTLLIDLIKGGYAALDNMVIETSNTPQPTVTPVPIPTSEPTATPVPIPTSEPTPISDVPEPTTLVLFGIGLGGLLALIRRKRS